MSDSPKPLKEQNAPLITAYLVVNCLVFWGLVNRNLLDVSFSNINVETLSAQMFAQPTLYSLVAFFLTKVLVKALPRKWVEVLVFWRLRYRLPGFRAFSHWMKRDPRINMPVIRSRFDPLPHHPVEQNRLWYTLYKKHSASASVTNAHKNYLLMRDITGLSVILAVILGVSGFRLMPFTIAVIYSLALIMMYLLISQAARSYAVDFVMNVLTEESVSSS